METTVLGAKTQNEKQTKYKEIQQTKLSPIFNVSADKVWEIVGPGFSDVHNWSRAVDHATTTGTPQFEGSACSSRSCDLNASGFSKISETMIAYDPTERKLGYTIDSGLPGFVIYMSNIWHVLEVGPDKSQIELTITVRMKPLMGLLMGGMFRKNINKVLDAIIEDLKIYAETGIISEAKRKRISKLHRANAYAA